MRALQIVKARVGLESHSTKLVDLANGNTSSFKIGKFKFEVDEKLSRVLNDGKSPYFVCMQTGEPHFWISAVFSKHTLPFTSVTFLIHKPNNHVSEIFLRNSTPHSNTDVQSIIDEATIENAISDTARYYSVAGRVALEERKFGFKNLSEDDRRRILFNDVVDRRHIDETKIDSYGSLVGSFSTRDIDNFEVDLTFRDFGSGGYVFRKGEYTVAARFSADLGLNCKVTYAIDLKTLSVQGLVDALAEVGVYKQLSVFLKKWSKESTARVALETPRALDLSTLSKDDITQIVLGDVEDDVRVDESQNRFEHNTLFADFSSNMHYGPVDLWASIVFRQGDEREMLSELFTGTYTAKFSVNVFRGSSEYFEKKITLKDVSVAGLQEALSKAGAYKTLSSKIGRML